MSEVKEFKGSLADLTSLVSGTSKLVVADFMASWCPSCRRLGMLLPKIAQENPEAEFIKIDIEENPELKAHYHIESIPVVKFLKSVDGTFSELDSVVGANVPTIKAKISELK